MTHCELDDTATAGRGCMDRKKIVSRLRFARMTDEREDPAVFVLIGTPKASIGKKTKLFQSVFEAEVIVR